MPSAAYIQVHIIRLDFIMEANIMNLHWEQANLGPYCLQYTQEHKWTKDQTTNVVTGGKMVNVSKSVAIFKFLYLPLLMDFTE